MILPRVNNKFYILCLFIIKLIQRIFFLTLVFSSISYCDAQDIWKLSMGLGLPELAHIGVSYQYSAEFQYHLQVRQKQENMYFIHYDVYLTCDFFVINQPQIRIAANNADPYTPACVSKIKILQLV